jgi:hypothetical protein
MQKNLNRLVAIALFIPMFIEMFNYGLKHGYQKLTKGEQKKMLVEAANDGKFRIVNLITRICN